MTKEPIVIVAAKRTPIGAFQGIFQEVSTTKLGAVAILGVIEETFLRDVDEVIMGCALPAALGQAPARQASIGSGLGHHVGATTINKICGSGMKSVMLAHDLLQAGNGKVIIAGGMENMTRSPYLLDKARSGYRLGHGHLIDHMYFDGLEDAYDKRVLMGAFAEACAAHFKFTREEQDKFTLESVMRAKNAVSSGGFSGEISSVTIETRKGSLIIEKDEVPDRIKIDRIPTLKAAFKEGGTITAATSSSISDGAAALMLMPEREANKRDLPIYAYIKGHATHSQEPKWFTTAPVGAVKKLSNKIHWKIEEVDLFEINEAFAVVTLAAMKELNIPHEKVNIHGGACALGHPIGASGARILVTLLHAMEKKNVKRGMAAICIGGGEATAIAVERPS